ncbi:hypothetical protein PG996_005959 [Apiospora saccharicola]|uniref:BTB domain-containing protein n=1 Tax=Apiospora saccharicola TaxID=335842 RepID=A0ABR1VMY4_9PEZI
MELKIVSRSDISRPDFSKYDRQALTGNFKEAQTNIVTLTTFAPEQVEMLICYLYTGASYLMLVAALNISSETATHELLKLLVDFVVVADYFLLDDECHAAVLERLRSCLSGGGTRRRWPEFVEAVEYAYGLHLADNETSRLLDARKVLVDWYNEKHETARKKIGPGAFSFLSQVPQFALDVLLARDRDEDK